jgi:hypothetical protein
MTASASRSKLDAVGYWRQFPVTAHFLEPMEIDGTLIELAEHKARDEYIPKLRIQQDDGTVVIVIAGQTRLQAELVKHAPAVGDRITISYTGEARRAAPGMNPTKEFTVTVRRPGDGSPGKAPQVSPLVSTPAADPENDRLLAARVGVSRRARELPIEKRSEYRAALTAAGLPELPADRSVDDCDAIWEILDKLGCPPLAETVPEPF